MLILVLAMFILFWPVVVTLEPRRLDPLKCAACGYLLIGNVSGICPECGRPRDSDAPVEMQGRRFWLLASVAALLAGIGCHSAFVITQLRHILHPELSPFGHENAFGDAGFPFVEWCLTAPLVLCAASAALACAGVIIARRKGTGIRGPLTLWAFQSCFLLYLGYTYFAWFFD